MKTETLVKIARQMGKELGETLPGTIDEVVAQLKSVAGHCKTKQAAIEAIAKDVYDVHFEDTPNLWFKATTLNV